jgi:iron complex outermembrane receptor protein
MWNLSTPSFTAFSLTPLAFALATTMAPAQAQNVIDSPKVMTLEEVVVTARRREESIQDVPVAITVMSAENLRAQRIETAQDLQGRVPSLVVGSAGQTRNAEAITIRGQGATYGASPGVVSYYAEVPLINDNITNGQGGPGKFFDLDNMQVLKGPQGTLFGRNTTGGALLISPQKPTNANEGYVKVSAGNYGAIGTEAVGNLVLIDDTLMVRAGLKTDKRDGFTKDVASGTEYDSRDYWTGRLGVTWKPTDNIENTLQGFYTKSADDGTGNVLTDINSGKVNLALWDQVSLIPNGCATFNYLTGSSNCGQDFVQQQDARGVRDVILSAQPRDRLTTWGVVNTLSVALNDNLNLRNILSYQRYQHSYRWDLDGSLVPFDDITTPSNEKQSDKSLLTGELQLQGDARDGLLEYVIGAYYEKSKPEGEQFQLANILFAPGSNSQGLETESYAPYVQFTYDLGDTWEDIMGLKLTVGVRHTRDKLNAFSTYYGYHDVEVNDSATTWTAGLDYQLPSGVLLYGKASRGYKGSAFSAQAVNPALYTADPEYVISYEAGFKSDFALGEMPARLNMAVYYTDYEDLQRATSDIYQVQGEPQPRFGSAMYNIGSATIAGFEMEATVEPMEGLQLSLAYSYTDADYEDYDVPVGDPFGQEDCVGAIVPFGGYSDLSCTPFQFVAENQFSLSARYQLPVDTAYGDISGALTYSWMDDQYTAPAAIPSSEPNSTIDSYGLLNLSLDWKSVMQSNFDVQVFATNLTDEKYRISNANLYQTLYVQSSIYGEPRMYGVALSYHWQ